MYVYDDELKDIMTDLEDDDYECDDPTCKLCMMDLDD